MPSPPIKEKYIDSPETLWKLFCDYVALEASNPMFRVDYVGRDGDERKTPLQVPITFEGFECYLADKDIIQDLGDYSKNKDERYTSYAPIISRIRKNCFVQNFKGASVGLFNANLIAKKLGLVEKTDVTTQGGSIQQQIIVQKDGENISLKINKPNELSPE